MELKELNTSTALEKSRRDREPFVFFDEDEVDKLKTSELKIEELPQLGEDVPPGWTREQTVLGQLQTIHWLASAAVTMSKATYGFGLVDRYDQEVPLVGVFKRVTPAAP